MKHTNLYIMHFSLLVMNSREAKRKERLEKIKAILMKTIIGGVPVSYDKTVAEIVYTFGIDGRKAKEDIKF
ncbi:MAG: hypothetical protein HC874_27375 [Richelia sp. SL_2_1]|nr:hypothetical protein [Richelia sp. SL_2_1]